MRETAAVQPVPDVLTLNTSATLGARVCSRSTLPGRALCSTFWRGGAIAPGNGPGNPTLNADLVLWSGVVYAAELAGQAAGTRHDVLKVNGAAGLDGVSLVLELGFVPSPTDRFFIPANDGSDAISGGFAGLPEGVSRPSAAWATRAATWSAAATMWWCITRSRLPRGSY